MKMSICILAHHLPFLIQSSIISILMQDDQDYDLHILYIKGDGENNRENYQEYNKLRKELGINNRQLSKDSPQILDLLNESKISYTLHEYENDHGLDSGVWYRFIRQKIWAKYDYSIFAMEGFMFTNAESLSSLKKFLSQGDRHVVGFGYETRFMPKNKLHSLVLSEKPNKLEYLHQEIINKVFDKFCSDASFKKMYDDYPDVLNSKHKAFGRHYVTSSIYSLKERLIIYRNNFKNRKYFDFPFGDFILQVPENISVKTSKIPHISFKKNKFFQEDSPYIYSVSCQHVYSKEYLNKLNNKFNEINIWEILNYPFVATPIEITWGLFPKWLGYQKWFFQGVYKPRKNFFKYFRIDNSNRVARLLNIFFKGGIKVISKAGLIKILKVNKKYRYLKNKLGDSFFDPESIK